MIRLAVVLALGLAAVVSCVELGIAWLHLDRAHRACPPYYECNGPAATRHPHCCPET